MRTARLLVLALALLTASLAASAAPPAATAASSCGSNFCTTAQRSACTQQCLSHGHHGTFVGLECCTDTCTTLCICGSVPVGC